MSRDEVKKYFEVHFYSLALMAMGIFVVFVFLLFFFYREDNTSAPLQS